MSDSYSDTQNQSRRFENNRDGSRSGSRQGRGPANRDQGGFRIRLSDNEMRSARSLQEAFNLRSTVAVLGFALRTLGQMLEEGKLTQLIADHQLQQEQREANRKEEGQRSYSNQRKSRSEGTKKNFENKSPKANPFARPEKPQSSAKEDKNESLELENQVSVGTSESHEISTNTLENNLSLDKKAPETNKDEKESDNSLES